MAIIFIRVPLKNLIRIARLGLNEAMNTTWSSCTWSNCIIKLHGFSLATICTLINIIQVSAQLIALRCNLIAWIFQNFPVGHATRPL